MTDPQTGAGPVVSFLGPCALLFEAGGGLTVDQQARIWAMARLAAGWPGVLEAVPGMTNLMLAMDQPPADPARLTAALIRAWHEASADRISSTLHEIPVTYGGEHAIDLDAVAARAGLTPHEVAQRHADGTYTVFALGSAPGFAYLGGLDPRLFTPRKSVPSLHMVRGSVTIGGMQTGVAATTGPNGWNAIGHAELEAFDPMRDPPALFAPGDTVRFRIARLAL